MTKYYRIEEPHAGAYGYKCDGKILAMSDKNVWLLTDEWSGDNAEGRCYRQHVAATRRCWPKSVKNVVDITVALAAHFDDRPADISLSEIIQSMSLRDLANLCVKLENWKAPHNGGQNDN